MTTDRNPFEHGSNPVTGRPFVAQTLEDRRAMVRKFDRAQCKAAMKLPGLQLGVIHALERRLREIAKQEKEQSNG